MNKNKIILLAIFLLSFILRFYKLGVNPPSLYWDEVSLGYNAYSILKTARDEFGRFLPIDAFVAFGDYKPVGYVYATVIPEALFGLNEFSVRFASAFAGVLMVVITYFFVRSLFHDEKISLIASFLLCVSPWSLQLSRAAFEANLAALFNLLGIYFFIKGIKEKGFWLIFSSIGFVLSFYTFNSNRILAPIFILILLGIYAKEIFAVRKYAVISFILGLILLAPVVSYFSSRESRLRFNEVNIFSDLDTVVQANNRISQDGGTRLAKIIHHRFIGHAFNYLKHYFDNFSGKFLFISGDGNPRLSIQSVGELYLWELPFFLYGLFMLFAGIKDKNKLFLLLWFFAAPIPAATARETPHALRIVSILPVPQIISAIGFVAIYKLFNNKNKRKIFSYAAGLLFILNFSYYLYNYYVIFPQKWAGEWVDGYKQAVSYISENYNSYDQIFFTNYYGRPYIYLLFYLKYDPQKYNSSVERSRDWYGNWQVLGFDKFRFSDNPTKSIGTLVFMPKGLVVSGMSKINEIRGNSGSVYYEVFAK